MLVEHEHVRAANIELVRRFVEAINDSWNVDVMRELVSDDFLFTIHSRQTGSRYARDSKIMTSAEYLDRTRFVIAAGGAVVPRPAIPPTG